ncbi:MAG TPA: MarR family transcriptional regulator [Streptosporangiaceae bacterium]
MTGCPRGDELDQEIFDAMAELFAQLLQRGERLAERFDVPVSCVKALRRLDSPITMKDLGLSMRCDPSFVTTIADALEERDLARREPSATDRRIKNLVLTPHGLEVKAAIEQEALRLMPWSVALDQSEREQFLELVRKMCRALAGMPGSPSASAPAKEVTTTTSTSSPAVH